MPASGRVYLSSCLLLFPPSALSLPKCSLRRTLYSTKRRIVPHCFSREQGGKKHDSTPICGRPTRAERPNVHIWPPLASKRPQNRHFSMERWSRSERAYQAAAPHSGSQGEPGVLDHHPPLRTSARRLADATRGYHSNLIRIRICAHRRTTRRGCVRAYKSVYSMIDLRPQPPSFRLVFLPPREAASLLRLSLFPISHSPLPFILHPLSFFLSAIPRPLQCAYNPVSAG